ncbi:bacteriocin immunity protein [Lactobacillus johnsonii]|uniref:bacteriocin immunity protein n=1 Tax=Lactobacillus johnsonii TaxID=33959 RepID=UPI002151741B|nr:bacteriocin immunity protein [Lactobacillus johnsonii]
MSSDKLKEEILKIKGTSDIVNDPEAQKLLDASIERIDKNMKNELAQVLNDFISLAKTHYDRKGNEYLLEQLEIALDKTNNNVQDAVNEARTTYQNVNTFCLVNHLHLEKDEEALLEKIKEISMSKGWLGGLNSWNTTNTWPGK